MTAFLQLVGQVQGPFLGLISIPPSLIRGWTSVERLMALFEDVEPDEHPVYSCLSSGKFHRHSRTYRNRKNDHYPADTGFGLSGKGTHRFDN